MAFIAFQEFGAAAAARSTVPVAPACATSGPSGLSSLEWSVVALARRDRKASLRQSSLLNRAVRWLFKQPNPMLADGRLEALRRMAVLSWHHGYTVPSADVRRFLDAGFTPSQYETLVDWIGSARARA